MRWRHGFFVITVTILSFVFCMSSHAENNRTHYYRGLDLYHAGAYEGAINAFNSQLRKTPNNAPVIRWLGLAKRRFNQETRWMDTKPQSFRRSRQSQNFVKTTDHFEEGIAYYMAKYYTAARTSFKRYLV